MIYGLTKGSSSYTQREALPHLQSLVIVLLRPILANVTAIVTMQSAQMTNGMGGRGNGAVANGGPAGHQSLDGAGHVVHMEEPEPSPEEVDAARTREITTKAMTGILLLLLKWLRASRICPPPLLPGCRGADDMQTCSSLNTSRSSC